MVILIYNIDIFSNEKLVNVNSNIADFTDD